MRKLLLIISLLFMSMVGIAQIEYPHLSVENGKQVVTFTIEQAQKINNDQELLKMFKVLNNDINADDSACVKVIDKQGNEIKGLKIEIQSLKDLNSENIDLITNLKDQIIEYKQKDILSTEEIDKYKLVVKEKDKQITKLKVQKAIGFIGGSSAIIALVYLFLHK